MYLAYATALARIDGQPVNEGKLAEYFFDRLADEKSPAATRVLALQLVPAKFARLNVAFLQKLLTQDDPALRLEAVRTLAEHPDGKRFGPLLERRPQCQARRCDPGPGDSGTEREGPGSPGRFVAICPGPLHRCCVRRRCVPWSVSKLSPGQQETVMTAARMNAEAGPLAARVLGKPFFEKRPPAKDIDAWLKHLEGPADAAAGRRVFAHPRLAGCYRCHRVEGRGNEVGPDLSTIGRTERRAILESILQPSNNIAPHYQAWIIETADGKVRTGLLTRTHLDDYTYLDPQGGTFKVNTRDVGQHSTVGQQHHARRARRPAHRSGDARPAGVSDFKAVIELFPLLLVIGSPARVRIPCWRCRPVNTQP